jgi:Ca-activated chloride channel family protein
LEASRGSHQTNAGKFVVLLTDGANTSGSLTPPQATAIARYRHIPVFALAAGRNGMVPFPIFDDAGRRIGTRQFPSSLDLDALKTMSAETGGRFLEVGDAKALRTAFRAVDAAKKVEFSVKSRRVTVELFALALIPALILIVIAAAGWARAPAPELAAP